MPLKATEARKLIRRLLDEGKFISPGAKTHARQEMEKDGLTDIDAVNVLRGGAVREPEWENGSWRYLVETPKMAFVATFDPEPEGIPKGEDNLSELELVLITAWRKKG